MANRKIRVLQTKHGYNHNLYTVMLPDGCEASDEELLTRLDNTTLDLDEPAGRPRHFGGSVTYHPDGSTDIRVSTD